MQYQQALAARRPVLPIHKNVMASLPRRRPNAPTPLPRRSIAAPVRVTTADIVKRLDVTTLAVTKWRQGSSVRPPLPVHYERVGTRPRVFFWEQELLEWLGVHRPDLAEQWRG